MNPLILTIKILNPMKTWPTWIVRARARLTRVKRGSVLMLTLLMTVGLTYMIATLLSSTVTEMKLNQRAQLTLEAKNAVESATEYAISIVRQKFDSNPNISGNYFINNPITIPTSISGFLWNGTDVSPSNVTVTVGLVPNEAVVYVDPSNPANAFDPSRGKNISAADVYVYASATAANGWGRQTCYGSQAVEVRDSALFTNAIFYNMDMEISPGPSMQISGPVHCNGNIWAMAQTALTFTGAVTASGNFNVGLIPYPTNWSTATSDTTDSGNYVFIHNPAGGYTTPFIGGNLNQQHSSSYWDSRQTNYNGTTYTNWREMSANLWGGNLQTSANGVPNEQVTGYNNFVFQVNGTSQDLNYAYSIIQPVQPSNITVAGVSTTNPWNLQEGETDKRNASVIVKVLAMGTANITQTVTVTGNQSGSHIANMTSNIDTNTTVSPLASLTSSNLLNSSGNMVAGTGQTISGVVQMHDGGVQNFYSNGTTQTSYPNGTWVNGTLPSGTAWSNPYATSNSSAVLLVTQTQAVTGNGNPAVLAAATGNYMELTPSASYNSTANTTTGSTTRYVGFALVEFDTIQTAVSSTTNTLQPVYNSATTVTDAYGDVIYPGDVQEQAIQVSAATLTNNNVISFSPGVGNMTGSSNGTAITSGYGGNVTDEWGGMYDARRGVNLSTLNLNVGALKNFVDNNSSNFATYSPALFTGTGSLAFSANNSYNGVVYVEFPELPGNTSRIPNATDNITVGNTTYPADNVLTSTGGNMGGVNCGLVLYNGTSSAGSTGVPNPNYASTSEGTVGRTPGFTVGTNNALYIDGSYNADGNMATPYADTSANQTLNSTLSDNISVPDPVCCVAADSVTVLSGNFNFRSGYSHESGSSSAYAKPTEVNTAILAGVSPASKYSSTEQSGSNNNFPRFLENWGSVDFRYRGSMVSLYESEIGDQPWAQGYYNAPNREWGFYNSFATGVYPPGTPDSRSYYRVNFSYLTQAAYTAAINAL